MADCSQNRQRDRDPQLVMAAQTKGRGDTTYVQALADLNVHTSQLRDWVKKVSDDPQHASCQSSDEARAA
jgi:hypothetical protein